MKPNEKMHGPLKQAYQKQTNFKDVAQQILHVDHLRLISEHIQCKIKEYDSYRMFRVAMNMDTIDITVDEPEEEYFHVKLGSQVKEPLMFEDIEKKSIADNMFNRFWGKLSEFFNKYFVFTGKPLPGKKHIQFQRNDMNITFQSQL
ncbi:hypothetical protein F5J12DRAFT_898658 [Pisolithus orientalis]|uniref:uncharacterized protein n=1 Tax=Pisolithus orientalis TaxID=936130 RepID=UPI0022246C78|nr:uncharacterized protein F5J12DRAFT_898658 [Pisolithus orientalis]KAI5986970.1 hypothetical protein F5J12DRAFT_898658 [Pisolithus orientalis]